MNIGIITRRGPEYHPNRRLTQAAAQRGHQVFLLDPYRQYCLIQAGKANLAGHDQPLLDAVIPRQGATLGSYCLTLIGHYELMGIPVINRLEAVRTASNKFLSLQALTTAGVPVPDTWFVTREEGLYMAVKGLGGYPVVAKQVSGRQGEGVVLVPDDETARAVINDLLDKRKGLLLQKFIPPVDRRDLRVLIIGGRVAGAMELTPKGHDFRANYHLSQDAKPVTLLEPHFVETALKAAGALGLDIAGVDILAGKDQRPQVIEVNYSPGFKGLEAATGLDIAQKIIEYVERACQNEVGRKKMG